jgi:Reverse transcriptase (RNA-dependent DNA polymerase)
VVSDKGTLFPLLFVFVAKGLSKLLIRGAAVRLFKDMRPTLQNGSKMTHLLYADDTLIFVQSSSSAIDTLKWILLAFEGFSSLKINFAKTEVFSFEYLYI